MRPVVADVAKELDAAPLWEGADFHAEVSGVYAGDLLSWVMSRLQEGNAWLTVMGNVNTIAVAVLGGAACVVLCEDAPLDAQALERAQSQGMAVLRTSLPIFEASVRLGRMF